MIYQTNVGVLTIFMLDTICGRILWYQHLDHVITTLYFHWTILNTSAVRAMYLTIVGLLAIVMLTTVGGRMSGTVCQPCML